MFTNNNKKIVCYFGSWSVYRPGNGHFDISYIDPSLCTHLIYAFAGLNEDGTVKVLDPWQDLPDNGGKDGYGRFNALREKSPSTKIMISMGGWNEGSSKYSRVMSDAAIRSKFVDNVVQFVKKYKFDGFDLDWEYPAKRGGHPEDVANLVSVLKDLKERFVEENLILSIAVGAAEMTASVSYDIPNLSKYVDFINLMTYDFHGSFDTDHKIGHHAPLYASSTETGEKRKMNIDSAVKYWLSQGAPAEKLILGTGFYGRSFTLENPANHEIGDSFTGPGAAGPYTREAGILGFNEIGETQKQKTWKLGFSQEQKVPYAYLDNQWIGYDNCNSLTEKAEYAKRMGLGGAMIWSIETDDFKGICGEKYPLLNSLNKSLRN